MSVLSCLPMRSLALAIVFVVPLAAQQPVSRARDSVARLPEVKVQAARPDSAVSAIQRLVLPVSASITAAQVQETVNILDIQDAVKYLPSLFVRKRNNGDTQSTLGTRNWGVGSSARSLVFADGVPLTALIANNNTIGGPRWGLVSPEEILRFDVLQGPFSAAYGGGSIGAVLEITTRQPERFEGSISQTQAVQRFDLYGTRDSYVTSQTGLHVGDRIGRFSFWVSGTYANSSSQPLTYVTAGANPANTTGGFPDANRAGTPISVLGATGLLGTDMVNGRVKLAYDLAPGVRAAYSVGLWHNSAGSTVQSYVDSAGRPTFARNGGFASGFYNLAQTHSSHSLSLRTDRNAAWDFEVVGSLYGFNTDRQRFPTTATGTDTSFGTAGRVTELDGTGWLNLDARGAWHVGGRGATHLVSFGAHADRYRLRNPTFNVPDWRTGDSSTASGLATRGDGSTRTLALWAQDRVRLAPTLNLTLGGRLEGFRAFDGLNINGSTRVEQPTLVQTRFSPKATLAWAPSPGWLLTASAAKAYRFATAAELYQLVSTGVTFTSPDPTLRPDDVFATELRAERIFAKSRIQLTLFRDQIRDAITSQFLPIVDSSATLFSVLANVDRSRNQGVEAVFATSGLGLRGLDINLSGTFLDATTLAISGRASATAPAGSAIGKQFPNVPKWRTTAQASYRFERRLALSLGARYQSRLFATLDNSDVNPNTYQGFASFFVADAKLTARVTPQLEAGLGVDNLNNRKYFLFHPFPQRTLVASLRATL